MDTRCRLSLALIAVTGLGSLLLPSPSALAHGGKYVPPPEDDTPPPPPDPPPPDREVPPREPSTPEPPPPPVAPPDPTPSTPPAGGGTPTLPPGATPPGKPPTPPTSAPTPGSRSGRRTAGPDYEDWSTWWYFSRTRYLMRREGTATPLEEIAPAASDAPEAWRLRSLTALRDIFPDPDTEIFTGCAVALGKAGDPADVPELLRLLRGRYRNPTIRESLVLALGLQGRGIPGVREALLAILRDRTDSARLRGFAGIALGLSGDTGAAPALLVVAAERGPRKDPAAGALMGLGLLGEDLVVPDLVVMLGDASDTDARALRPYAAYALARIGGAEAVAALGKGLGDADEQVRRASAAGLGECNADDVKAWIPVLGRLAREDRDRPVRSFAMLSLGRLGGAAALEALSRCYGLGDRGERNFAALGLALYGRGLEDVEGRRRIASLLRGEFEQRADAGYRGALAVSLGLLADERAVPALRAVLKDRGDPELRAHCALALGMIGARDAAPDLHAVLDAKGQPDLSREAALALGLLGDSRAADALAELVGSSSSEYVRASAATALGQLRGPAAAAALEKLLRDGRASDAARGQAAVGLGLLLDPRPQGAMASLAPGLDYFGAAPVVMEVLSIP